MMHRPQGVLFDYGSTLLTQVALDWEAGTARVLELAGNPGHVRPEDCLALRKQLDELVWPKRDQVAFEFPVQTYLRVFFERLGIRFNGSLADAEREFWKAFIRLEPEPDLAVALETLQEMGLPLGIVSNSAFSGEVLLEELKGQGLAEPFQFLMSSADYGFRKPHPVLLETAAVKLGLAPEAVWYVGDMLEYDVEGARAAGMKAVWYNRLKAPLEGPRPHLEVEGWKHFAAVLRELPEPDDGQRGKEETEG